MKRAVTININYLKKHIEDIANNTDVLLPQFLIPSGSSTDKDYHIYYEKLLKKHLYESGNWYIFGRGERWIGKNETWEEAEDRIVRDYCKATGHWDLFIWEEVEK